MEKNPSSAAKSLSTETARAQQACTKCGTYHGGNGYVVAKQDAAHVDGIAASGDLVIRNVARQVVSIHEHPSPTYSHCASCALAYSKRLERRDRNTTKNRACRQYKANLGQADCTIVAISTTTGMPYSKVEAAAKRLVGYKVGKGLNSMQWGEVLRHCAAKRGKVVSEISWGERETFRQLLAKERPAGSTFAASCRLGNKGHAVPVVKGQPHNVGRFMDARVQLAWLVSA